MLLRVIWIANMAVRAAFALAMAMLLALCIAAPDSAAGAGMHDTLAWIGQTLADLITRLNPIGIHIQPGGGTVPCFIASADCQPEPLAWPSLSLSHLLPPYLTGRAILAAVIALMTLAAFGRRRTR